MIKISDFGLPFRDWDLTDRAFTYYYFHNKSDTPFKAVGVRLFSREIDTESDTKLSQQELGCLVASLTCYEEALDRKFLLHDDLKSRKAKRSLKLQARIGLLVERFLKAFRKTLKSEYAVKAYQMMRNRHVGADMIVGMLIYGKGAVSHGRE